MIDLLAIIQRLEQAKKNAKVEPCFISQVELLNEVVNEAKNEINRLCQDGKIGYRKTLNQYTFYTKGNAESE